MSLRGLEAHTWFSGSCEMASVTSVGMSELWRSTCVVMPRQEVNGKSARREARVFKKAKTSERYESKKKVDKASLAFAVRSVPGRLCEFVYQCLVCFALLQPAKVVRHTHHKATEELATILAWFRPCSSKITLNFQCSCKKDTDSSSLLSNILAG